MMICGNALSRTLRPIWSFVDKIYFIGLTRSFRSNFEETVDSQRYIIVTVLASHVLPAHKGSLCGQTIQSWIWID